MNNYIINKNYLIKNDLPTLLLYYDYFSVGINLPRILQYIMLKKIIHSLLRLFIYISYVSRLYLFFYKTINLDIEDLIVMKGVGKWKSTISLILDQGNLFIVKTTTKIAYAKERKFYTHYENKKGKIVLPKYEFLKKNRIKIKFIKAKTLQRLINDGSLSFKEAINKYKNISDALGKFYNKNYNLIHGDTFPSNIFVKDNKYYLIDFTESRFFDYRYDYYNLLFAILCSFNYISSNTKSLINYKKINVLQLLQVNVSELKTIEREFIIHREKRFPGFYDN